MSDETRRLTVASLARVEGEGALSVTIEDGLVTSSRLQIYEPPRFFEALLRDRAFTEVADITSRICGICPVAYQTSALQAVEGACGYDVPTEVAELRRLLYCGEWISSHALHIYLLHAPDFLGHPDVISLARADRAAVERGLALKKVGNAVLEAVGGRAIHPVNMRVGGFHRAPTRTELAPLAEQLRAALDQALATVEWVAGFDFPEVELTHELMAVVAPDRYAIENGTLATSSGDAFPPAQFLDHVVEHHLPHTTALQATLDGRLYLTGPLARYSISSGRLSPLARQAAAAAGLGDTCRNPFRSVIVRAVETVYAVEEALRIIDGYRRPETPAPEIRPREGVGHGVSEAPRGLLYHRYELAPDGLVRTARIIPPTSQNQAVIEDDLRRLVQSRLELDDGALTELCERTIRNYDPCIARALLVLVLTVSGR
jgi:coenzyme F420-reducing hydrogenase alpha subunit